MKANIYVTLKTGVLDPQGKAIHHSAEMLGHLNIEDIRQGKFFEIYFKNDVTAEEAGKTARKLADEMLANPVIEDYRIEIVE
ncbi:MAG: phosphoribosylformylglycinamidine synthase subunit PurS [Pyrinomonadaceae bacterium]|jgi:phosphoribosylformylglycinamidine synthase PurS subunit